MMTKTLVTKSLLGLAILAMAVAAVAGDHGLKRAKNDRQRQDQARPAAKNVCEACGQTIKSPAGKMTNQRDGRGERGQTMQRGDRGQMMQRGELRGQSGRWR